MVNFISHQTALRLMGLGKLARVFYDWCEQMPDGQSAASSSAVGSAPTWAKNDLIHLTTTARRSRQKIDGSVYHYLRPPLPRGAVRRLGARSKGITNAFISGEGELMIVSEYIASPELTFLQLAGSLSVTELILLGLEMCGSTHNLTTSDNLIRMLEKLAGHHGVNMAKRAASYIADGSESVMESITYMLLCLPRSLGGFGLPEALLNHTVPIKGKAGKATSKKLFRCDLYWPDAQVAVEYDSTLHHSAQTRITEDAVRRDVLANQSVTVMTLTWPLLRNRIAMERFVVLLAGQLGYRLRAGRTPNKQRQDAIYALIARLSGSTAE
jgi:hypothetical protein